MNLYANFPQKVTYVPSLIRILYFYLMKIAHLVVPYFRNVVAVAVCLIVGLGVISAQTDAMLQVSGTIKDDDSGRKLPGCMIVVFQDGDEFDRIDGDNNAGYSFELPLFHQYTFQYLQSF